MKCEIQDVIVIRYNARGKYIERGVLLRSDNDGLGCLSLRKFDTLCKFIWLWSPF